MNDLIGHTSYLTRENHGVTNQRTHAIFSLLKTTLRLHLPAVRDLQKFLH